MVLHDELSTAVRSSTLVAQTAQAANQLVTSTGEAAKGVALSYGGLYINGKQQRLNLDETELR